MKKIYVTPKTKVVNTNLHTQMCGASKNITSSNDLVLGSRRLLIEDDEDDYVDDNANDEFFRSW